MVEIDYQRHKSFRGEKIISSLLARQGFLGGEVVGCDLSETKVKNCIFYKLPFKQNSSTNAIYTSTRFVMCDILDNNFLGTTFQDCVFENCNLGSNSFAVGLFERVEFINCGFGINGYIDLTYRDLVGLELKRIIDSKGNPMIYNVIENRINHIAIAGTPQDCIRHLWETKAHMSQKYIDELVSNIKSLTVIKTGRDTIK